VIRVGELEEDELPDDGAGAGVVAGVTVRLAADEDGDAGPADALAGVTSDC
jgi:hypothetical protein